jgi:hypothetical protein
VNARASFRRSAAAGITIGLLAALFSVPQGAASVELKTPGVNIVLPITLGSVTVSAITAAPGFSVNRRPDQSVSIALNIAASDSVGGAAALHVSLRSTSTPDTARIGDGGPCAYPACGTRDVGTSFWASANAPQGLYGLEVSVTSTGQSAALVVPLTVEISDATSTRMALPVVRLKFGQQVTVSGHSMYYLGGWLGWPGASVMVQYRRAGTATWRTLGRPLTDDNGRYMWRTTAKKTGDWRVITPPRPYYAGSVSTLGTVVVAGAYQVNRFTTCTAMRRVFAGGIASRTAENVGAALAYAPFRSRSWWRANKSFDRDGDGLSCER